MFLTCNILHVAYVVLLPKLKNQCARDYRWIWPVEAMLPDVPVACGIRNCFSTVVQAGACLKCDGQTHHRGFLVRDSTGQVCWKWCTRGQAELIKKGFHVLTEIPREEPETSTPVKLQESREESPEKVTPEKRTMGRANFGGVVCRKASCVVCGVARDDYFHGLLS